MTAPSGSPYAARPWVALLTEAQRAPVDPADSLVHALRASAGRAADRTCLAYFDGRLTYREVDALSDSVAGHLAARGLRRGDRVAVMLQNSPHFVLAVLGAWKAGAVVVPVNPMYKSGEVAHVLKDAGVTALICTDRAWDGYLRESAAGSPVRIALTACELDFQTRNDARLLDFVRLPQAADADDLTAVARAGHRPPEDRDPDPDAVALISYTSGTSGTPKGATNTHGNIMHNAERQAVGLALPDPPVYFALAPLFHITGMVCQLSACLTAAGTLVLAYRFEAGVVLDAFAAHRPHYTVGPSTAFMALAAHPRATRDHFASFAMLSSGGAPLPPALVEEFRAGFGTYIRNGYGLTESTATCTVVPPHLEAPVDPASGTLAVGVPGPDTVVRILDERGEEVPFGTPGEIVVRGPQIVPGYWHRPDATAETFPGGELRTGDIGFMDGQGWLYVVDRKKDMINASGFKVWPREVEDILYTHPAVREVAVVGVPDGYRGETVKAYISLRPGADADPGELAAYCKERLAAYKYPRQVEILADLPKTASGKILRRELRSHAHGNRQRHGRQVAAVPRTTDGDGTPVPQRLLAAATRLFAEQGYDRTSVQEIVEAAGVTKGALYHYFGSKDDLLHEVYARVLRVQQERLDAVADADEPVEKRVRDAAADVVVTTIENLDDASIFFRSMHHLSPEKNKQVRAERRRYHERFRALIEEGQETGVFSRATPADLVVDYHFGSVHHLSTWYRPDGPLGPREVADHLADLLLRALRP